MIDLDKILVKSILIGLTKFTKFVRPPIKEPEEKPLVGIDNWNVEPPRQHAAFSMNGQTIPRGIDYEVDPYNNKKCRPQCLKCRSTVIPKTMFGHDKFFDRWDIAICFSCGREPQDCKCEANTCMDYEHVCSYCGATPSTLSWGVGVMICSECNDMLKNGTLTQK